ncbi:MAG: zinc-binding dehydrogenase [Clostridiaceae bacterium]|nr:zinc-binding dehydrogenase [Clostridiaceae bacterium]
MEAGIMKAVCISKPEHVEIIAQKRPVPGPNEVVIKVVTSMLCTWEQRVFSQVMPIPLPFVGGHEFAGVIETIGSAVDAADFPIGSRCAASITNACGTCEACRAGKDSGCIHKRDNHYAEGRNGLAQYVLADAKNVYLFSEEIPFERIMFTEPLACVISAHDKFDVQLGSRVAVQGAGLMGLMNARIAQLEGAFVAVFEPDPKRREMALTSGVCDVVLDPSAPDFHDKILEVTDSHKFDVVINTVAVPSAVSQSLDACAHSGTFLMYGKVFPDKPVPIDLNRIQDSCIKIAGSMAGEKRAFYRAARLLEMGRLKPEKDLLSGIYDLNHAQEAYEAAVRPDTFRVAINFSDYKSS